jgi:hypothetical protein
MAIPNGEGFVLAEIGGLIEFDRHLLRKRARSAKQVQDERGHHSQFQALE